MMDEPQSFINPVYPPCDMMYLHHALHNGAYLVARRTLRSLRIVRVMKTGELIGYGEHPHLEEALRHANEDVRLGHQEYSQVYGVKYMQYLTGSQAPFSPLDRWVLEGGTFLVLGQQGYPFTAKLRAKDHTFRIGRGTTLVNALIQGLKAPPEVVPTHFLNE